MLYCRVDIQSCSTYGHDLETQRRNKFVHQKLHVVTHSSFVKLWACVARSTRAYTAIEFHNSQRTVAVDGKSAHADAGNHVLYTSYLRWIATRWLQRLRMISRCAFDTTSSMHLLVCRNVFRHLQGNLHAAPSLSSHSLKHANACLEVLHLSATRSYALSRRSESCVQHRLLSCVHK